VLGRGAASAGPDGRSHEQHKPDFHGSLVACRATSCHPLRALQPDGQDVEMRLAGTAREIHHASDQGCLTVNPYRRFGRLDGLVVVFSAVAALITSALVCTAPDDGCK